jgi:protein-S-isoprenylcysteine O-methyltransferase Ste14
MRERRNDLRAQAWGSTSRTLLVLAAVLFLSAFTLYDWRAWMYWVIYAMALCFNTAYFLRRDPALVARRLRAGPTAEPSRRQRYIQAVTAVCLLLMFALAGFDHRLSWSSVPASVSIVAEVVFVIALVMIFLVFTQNSYAGSVVEVVSEQSVATHGLYGCVRHPMYFASAIAFLATPVALGSIWGLIGAVSATISMIVRLQDEEQQLHQRLPGYAAYCRRVRFRLCPGIW